MTQFGSAFILYASFLSFRSSIGYQHEQLFLNSYCVKHYCEETFAKRPLLPNFCVPDERDLSTGSNFARSEALVLSSKYSMYGCLSRCSLSGWLIRLRRIAFLELEPRLNIKTDLTGQAKLSIFQRSRNSSA